MTIFSLYRLIELAKKVDKTTLQSIVSPLSPQSEATEVCGELKVNLRRLFLRYVPQIFKIPLNQGISWVPTWKALPSSGLVREVFKAQVKELGLCKSLSSIFPSLMFGMRDFAFLLERVHVSYDHVSQGMLWPRATRFAFDRSNLILSELLLEEFYKVIGPKVWSFRGLQIPAICGRLGVKVEGGGKRRIFAIGNYINQRLLSPVHHWLMEVLKLIPMDGTFNQTAPLDRLIGARQCYSFDLKSATDRWPLQILFEMLVVLFDRSFASSIRSCLALNLFQVPFGKRRDRFVSFVTGQPLGYYASWALPSSRCIGVALRTGGISGPQV